MERRPINRGGRTQQPVIVPEKCTGCGSCIKFCGDMVLVFDKGPRKARVACPANCRMNCRICAGVCPSGAVTFPDEEAFISYLRWRLQHQQPVADPQTRAMAR